MLKELWAIKYRPTTLENYLFQNSEHEKNIKNFIENKTLPNILLSGHRGTGKTTLALILKDALGIEDCDFLKLNASDDNSTDVIRQRVKTFASTMAAGPFKLIFLDEAEFISLPAQAILRGITEDTDITDNTRFIATCNYPQKLMPELRSRFQEYKFDKLDKNILLEKAAEILVKEKIKIPSIELLEQYVDMSYPDFRKLIVLLEQNSTSGALLEPTNVDSNAEYKVKILELLELGDWQAIRDIICNNVDIDEYPEVYKFVYDYIHEVGKFKDVKKWKQAVIILADAVYKHDKTADPELNFTACIIRLVDL